MKRPSPAKQELCRAILKTLKNMAPPISQHDLARPQPSIWPSTRQISEAHDISIYKARVTLLEMVELGLVTVSDRAVSNSLRWLPREEAAMTMTSRSEQNETKKNARDRETP
ncbi:hypothetical protein I5P78_26055 [Serratia marcescens]|nr:hypothetical protein [Serratia marcescens]